MFWFSKPEDVGIPIEIKPVEIVTLGVKFSNGDERIIENVVKQRLWGNHIEITLDGGKQIHLSLFTIQSVEEI